jgi:hypothetical protein
VKSKKNSTHHTNFSSKQIACHTEMENENEIITHILPKKGVNPSKYTLSTSIPTYQGERLNYQEPYKISKE